jgi:hypothetical protein
MIKHLRGDVNLALIFRVCGAGKGPIDSFMPAPLFNPMSDFH